MVVNTVRGEGESILKAARSATEADFSMIAVSGLDWNRDMSPWEAPPIYGSDPPFAGGASVYLQELTERTIPAAQEEAGLCPEYAAIAGYSLAGLFAIFSLYRTDAFSRAASVSGSLWFPGIIDFVRRNDVVRVPDKVYMSLGDRESKVRNEALSKVEINSVQVRDTLASKGIDVVYETNPGNHFRDPEMRMAKGIARILTS
ncbi:MAG: hypothetical protein IKQ60_03650 [Candidatus Methanomethylophilaceae archaeon]|nr:hypothetical protein [Candidatus Methanomethylophilaceae archaeon]